MALGQVVQFQGLNALVQGCFIVLHLLSSTEIELAHHSLAKAEVDISH